jgi:putative DNA primase/helicase
MSEKHGERIYLAVAFAEKDEAKALGARWDKAAKSWYIPSGSNPASFERWRPARSIGHSAPTNPVEEFAEVLAAFGLILKGAPIMDGRIHRVPVDGDRMGQRSGAYAGHLDACPGGYIENFKAGERRNWKSAMPPDLLGAADRARLLQEIAARRAEREIEFRAIHADTVRLLQAHLAACAPTPDDHPYLLAKGVQPYGVLIDRTGPLEITGGREHAQKWSAKGALIIPIRDIDGRLVGAQSIDAAGRKSFARGSRLAGGMHRLGAPNGEMIVIAEGYATGATIHEATDLPIVVAFNAGNLQAVALAVRGLQPNARIIVAGDNDHQKPRTFDADGRPKPNVGRVAAEQAAAAVGGFALLPTFAPDDPGTDWNDLARSQGAAALSQQWQTGMAVGGRRFDARLIAAAREGATKAEPESEQARNFRMARSR